jgi:DNA (cytosine-5)-methyltransferase 1
MLDLFSGIGGFHLGLEQAGFKFDWVGFSEIDKYAIQQYQKRFPRSEYVGSVTDVQPGRDLPNNIDILCGGFPCQAFSIAGKRKGFDDTRGTLFFEIARILRYFRDVGKPIPYFILENVKGLLNHEDGRTFATIYGVLADLDYTIECQLLNTRWFLPQNRERIYIVGRFRGESRPKIFPIRENGRENPRGREDDGTRISAAPSREYGWKKISPTLCARDHKDPKLVKIADYRNDEGLRVRKDGNSPCLSTRRHSKTDISTMPPLLIKSGAIRGREGKPQGNLEIRKDDVSNTILTDTTSSLIVKPIQDISRNNKKQNGRRIKEGGEDMFTLTSQGPHGVMIEGEEKPNYGSKALNETLEQSNLDKDDIKALDLYNRKTQDHSPALTEPHHNTLRLYDKGSIRRLTPIECERLQGFPDGWTEGQSDTQRYKQLGNAVSVPVVKAIGKVLKKMYDKK